MNPDVIPAIMPALVAGIAVQQLLEVVDSGLASLFGSGYAQQKTGILGLLGIFIGFAVSYFGNVTMLSHLGVASSNGGQLIDTIVTGLFIGTGSAGANSLLKLANYSKERQKASAANVKFTAAKTLYQFPDRNALSLVDGHGLPPAFDGRGRRQLVDGISNLVSSIVDKIRVWVGSRSVAKGEQVTPIVVKAPPTP